MAMRQDLEIRHLPNLLLLIRAQLLKRTSKRWGIWRNMIQDWKSFHGEFVQKYIQNIWYIILYKQKKDDETTYGSIILISQMFFGSCK